MGVQKAKSKPEAMQKGKPNATREYTICVILFLFSLYLLHPLLHECGHALAATMLGMNVSSVQLFPETITVVEMSIQTIPAYCIIAVMGWMLPLAVSCIPPCTLREAVVLIPLRVLVMLTAIGELWNVGQFATGSITEPMSDFTNILASTDIEVWPLVLILLPIIAAASASFVHGIIAAVGMVLTHKHY